MKKKIFILVFLSTAFFNSFSQNFKAGLIAGVVSSDMYGADIRDVDVDYNKAGFTAGGILNTKLTDKSSFQFEILYVQKGSYTPPDSLWNWYKLSLDYVEVPMIYRHCIKLRSTGKPFSRFSYEIGPSMGILAHIKQDGNSFNNGIYNGGVGGYNNSQFRKLELAANIGFTYNLSENFMLDFRYSYSIIPVTHQPVTFNYRIWYDFNMGKNTVLSFTLRCLFGGSKKEQSE